MSVTADPTAQSAAIENLLAENRTFPPDPAFVAQAKAKADLYAEAEKDPVDFWARLARERLDWDEPFTTPLEWDLPFAKWFVGGRLNIAYNCVDRHVKNGLGDKVAYHWIGEPGDTRTITYADLHREVQKTARALTELGVGTGDRVAIAAYLGSSDSFDQAIVEFAHAYAEQNDRDYRALGEAAASGRIVAEAGL